MRIAISGLSGCGNTTVSSLLAERLGYEVINFTFRNLAEQKNISFEELCNLAKEDDKYDLELDSIQVRLAMSHENCILASRLAIWMLKDADLKVYIDISSQERARRIHKREGDSLELRMKQTQVRDESDTKRYKKLYNIDNTKPEEVADFIIKDDKLSAEQIVDLIIKKIDALK